MRTTRAEPWGEPRNIGAPVNTSAWEGSPSIAADGLSLYFSSNREKLGTIYRALGYLYVATRPTKDSPWGAPTRLGSVVNPQLAYDSDYPRISPDGLSLYFRRIYSSESVFDGKRGHWVATRDSTMSSWSRAVYLGLRGASPSFSPDGGTMTFCSHAYGGYGDSDLFQVPIITVNSVQKSTSKDIGQ
jgi:Tol biopolymer transport system component